jgi:hypothetical protein
MMTFLTSFIKTSRRMIPPPGNDHLKKNILIWRNPTIFADTVGFVNDETMFDAEVIGHIEELQWRTANPLPFAAGHWQGDAAQGGDVDGDYKQ